MCFVALVLLVGFGVAGVERVQEVESGLEIRCRASARGKKFAISITLYSA